MSDGPHRALPMRPAWKRVAERADNSAHHLTEVTDAIADAAARDFRTDTTPALMSELRKIADGKQDPLFKEESLNALARAKRDHAIEPRARDFVDRVMAAIVAGKSGLAALRTGVEQSVRQTVASCLRQIEEFYRRKTGASRSFNVRARLNQAARGLVMDALVQRILAPKADTGSRGTRKKGVDDGVPFS